MIKKILLILSFILLFRLCPSFAVDMTDPKKLKSTGHISDFANVITSAQKSALDSIILSVKQKTSAEIAVVTIPSIAPYDEKEYAYLLFNNWKIGEKNKNNGVLILLALKERRWRIEVGKGIEGIFTSETCESIANDYMTPYFKEGNYSDGIYWGTLKIAQIISGAPLYEFENYKWGTSLGEAERMLKDKKRNITEKAGNVIVYNDEIFGIKCDVTLYFTPTTKVMWMVEVKWKSDVFSAIYPILKNKYGQGYAEEYKDEFWWGNITEQIHLRSNSDTTALS